MSDDDFTARNQIVLCNVICNVCGGCDDSVSFAAGTLETDVVIVALQPVIAMLPVAEETQILNCSYLMSINFYNVMPHGISFTQV